LLGLVRGACEAGGRESSRNDEKSGDLHNSLG
jgi:hypothetical protein